MPWLAIAEYREPSEPIAALLDARPGSTLIVAPGGERAVILERPRRPSIVDLARPSLHLAGLRFDARTLTPPPSEPPGRSRPSNRPPPGSLLPPRELQGGFENPRLVALDAESVDVPFDDLPKQARLLHPMWSPDGKHLALTVVLNDRSELWVSSSNKASSMRLTSRPINSVAGWPCRWRPDSTGLLCRSVASSNAVPDRSEVPDGPMIQQHSGDPAPTRTYQGMLKSPHDEALLAHYLNVQLIDVALTGRVREVGQPGLHVSAEYSPDGRYILVKTQRPPFSYVVPLDRFAATWSVWNPRGEVVHEFAELPLAEQIPIGRDSVRTGARITAWRSDADATLYWVAAADGGDAKADADVRDELFLLAAPFNGMPVKLAQLSQRFLSVQWSGDDFAIVWDDWWENRNRRAFIYRPGTPDDPPRKLFDFSIQDAYADPGAPMMMTNASGFSVLYRSTNADTQLLLAGFGATPAGDQPFLRRFDVATEDIEVLWQSQPPHYEETVSVLSESPLRLVIQRESQQSPPAFWLHADGQASPRRLTNPPNPYPALEGVQSEMLRYQRSDGVWLTAHLYLPSGYSAEDGPLPAVLWAYPLEYRDAAEAGQVSGSPYRFPTVSLRSMVPWLTAGYVIMDNVSMPIVGEGDAQPNDTFVEQLVASAAAAIDEGVRRNIVDPNRVAIAGHSYGAFMTAHLLAYSDLFRTGIARSGAYNRSLTPFGFQREERTVWEAPDLYRRMSPFMQADKINEPLLLIHGADDENSGTHPLQSERLFAALKGLGGDARLVMLPLEGHSYLARESVLHQAAEISDWLAEHLGDTVPTETN